MSSIAPPLVSALAAAAQAIAAVTSDIADYRGLDDAEFGEAARLSSALLRAAQAQSALIAGEVAYRSRPELGSSGLAQREGFRTPEEMVRVTTGSTAREAVAAVRVGRIVHESAARGSDIDVDSSTGEVAAPQRAWLMQVGQAVAAGNFSIGAAESIYLGLALYRQHDGMGRLVWTLDPETLARVGELFDRATSPSRGGPRFVDSTNGALAEKIALDPRTTAQLASDVFEHLLVHNNHWEIERQANKYWLIPPPDIDPHQRRRPLPSTSTALRELAVETHPPGRATMGG